MGERKAWILQRDEGEVSEPPPGRPSGGAVFIVSGYGDNSLTISYTGSICTHIGYQRAEHGGRVDMKESKHLILFFWYPYPYPDGRVIALEDPDTRGHRYDQAPFSVA
jgi:hypothetical protein